MENNETPARGKLAAALAKAQAEYLPLKKSRTATIKMKSGGEYSYDYADLADMIESTKAALAKNGLAVTQLIFDDRMETRLMHDSGEELSSVMGLPKGLPIQEFGSAITYRRRYALGPILGIASEEDDDATASTINGDRASKAPPLTEPRKQAAPTTKPQPAKTAPPPAAAPQDPNKISVAQAQRLQIIAKKNGWLEEGFRAYLQFEYGVTSSKDILKKDYDLVCDYFASKPGPETGAPDGA